MKKCVSRWSVRESFYSFLTSLALFWVLGCQKVQTSNEPAQLTLLGLNDLHGTIEARPMTLGNKSGERQVQVGGLAMMAGYLGIARKHNPKGTLLLDSGDIYQGSLISNFFQGLSLVDAYNALGVDATTLGNHEFDFGDVKNRTRDNKADPQGALRAIIQRSKFATLTANVYRRDETGEHGFPGTVPSKIVEVNGIKVGLIGATTLSTRESSMPKRIEGLVFKQMHDVVPKEAAKLRGAGAKVVILLAHAGGRCDVHRPPEEGDKACSAGVRDEITQFLDDVPTGTVDAVFAGHMHLRQAHFIRGVPVVQTIGFGTSFSRVDLWVDKGARPLDPPKRRIVRAQIFPTTYFCHTHFSNYHSCDVEESKEVKGDLGAEVPATYEGENIAPEKRLEDVLSSYRKGVSTLVNQPVTDLPLGLSFDRTKESPLSNCLTDTVMDAVAKQGHKDIDLCIMHSGGFRVPLKQGKVTYGDLFRVLPFDNNVVQATITGSELEAMGVQLSTNIKNIAVISEGWKVRLTEALMFPRHRGFIDPMGNFLLPERRYRILTNDFNTAPGGYLDAVFARARQAREITTVSDNMRDLVAEHFKAIGNRLPASCLGKAKAERTVLVK